MSLWDDDDDGDESKKNFRTYFFDCLDGNSVIVFLGMIKQCPVIQWSQEEGKDDNNNIMVIRNEVES
jgi:hypothetical protein